jgi:hypothetical protein
MGGSSGGSYPPHDTRGQGGGNRDSYRLPNEGLEQAKYSAALGDEDEAAAAGKKPTAFERFKRWFSNQF